MVNYGNTFITLRWDRWTIDEWFVDEKIGVSLTRLGLAWAENTPIIATLLSMQN